MPTVACGAGTELHDGQCLPVDSGMPDYGDKDAGSKKDSGKDETPVDAGGGGQTDAQVDTVSCGEGTIKVNGKCVVNPANTLTCGDGTTPVDGKCEVAPPPPVELSEMVISQLSVRNRGQLIADGGKIHQFYPVEVSVGITYKGDAARIPVVFALGEPPDPDKTEEEEKDLGFCLVGGFHIDHPGGSAATESITSATLSIPKGCLPANKPSIKVNPIVMIDPDLTLDVTDHDAISRMVVFAKKNDVDADMAACRIETNTDGTKGTCQIEADVEASPGLDFELAELTAESSVIVLDKCPPNADPDRPESYKCNHAIVPEFKILRDESGKPILDSNGNQQIILQGESDPEPGAPVQATYMDGLMEKDKWVYGPADLDLDVTVMAWGADDSKLDSIDDTDGLSPTDNSMAVNNVLADHGLQIKYEIRRADSEPTSGAPEEQKVWLPLYMHKQGEQAKADEAGESGQVQEQFEETKVVPATPHYYSHGLYVENDCGERNGDTCDHDINPRTEIISGDWETETDFVVRACLVPVDDSGAPDAELDDNAENNCREIPIKIVRHDTSANIAASYGFNFQWGDGAGSQTTMRLGWGLHSWNKVDVTGATVDNEAAVSLGSDLIGYTDILKGWAKGAAYTSITNSFYDYGISTFGAKLWGDAKSIPSAYHWGYDWNVSKELRRSTIVWAGAVPIELSLRFGGVAGIAVDLDLLAMNPIPNVVTDEAEVFVKSKATGLARAGLAQLAVTPYGQMTATASAAVTAGVVRVGVAGDLTLINMRTPLTGRLWWGTNFTPLVVKTGAWADLKLNLNVMSGEVYLFAENQSLEWCKKRVKAGFVKITVRYPCGLQWSTFWDMDIADWDGWTWNQTLWTSPYVEYTLQ